MEHLRINHASGYIDLYVDTFFPCPLQKARKVFRLINQWCPQEERQELMEYLLERAQAYEASIESNTQQLQLSLMPHMKKREVLKDIPRRRRLLRRLQRNMEYLEVT